MFYRNKNARKEWLLLKEKENKQDDQIPPSQDKFRANTVRIESKAARPSFPMPFLTLQKKNFAIQTLVLIFYKIINYFILFYNRFHHVLGLSPALSRSSPDVSLVSAPL